MLALEDRRQGRSDLAAERIRSSFPSFAEPSPVVAARILRRSLPAATALAAIYLETNQEDKAEALIEAIEKEVSFRTRIGGYELADVEVLALRGRKEEALKALQSAVDAGWRRLWWFQLDYHPALDSIRDLPEFAAIRADLEARVAVDRDKVRNALRDKFATLVATRFL